MCISVEKALTGNAYPGRGIMVGLTPDGKNAVAAYFIMGRSVNSRNRVFAKRENGDLYTKAFDESLLSDPSLIIYNAIRNIGDTVVVTNGDQTDTIYDFLVKGASFEEALLTREFEPDAPNFTPRISAMLTFDGAYKYKMSILKNNDGKGTDCNRFTYDYAPVAGLAHFIHTYQCDGDPLPSFEGEPEKVQTVNCIDEFTDKLWNVLDDENKISLCVRYINLESKEVAERIINKNK
ncbi:MAG: IMP cyclohydrolase [Clostridia bacterium]|nr:IMP cyclohydrolase [Clostridia bacterium]